MEMFLPKSPSGVKIRSVFKDVRAKEFLSLENCPNIEQLHVGI